jgi:hypothetical protein
MEGEGKEEQGQADKNRAVRFKRGQRADPSAAYAKRK